MWKMRSGENVEHFNFNTKLTNNLINNRYILIERVFYNIVTLLCRKCGMWKMRSVENVEYFNLNMKLANNLSFYFIKDVSQVSLTTVSVKMFKKYSVQKQKLKIIFKDKPITIFLNLTQFICLNCMNKLLGHLTNAALLSTEFCLTSNCKYSLILRRSRSIAVTHSLPSPSDGLHSRSCS